jgi:hypothetical protein
MVLNPVYKVHKNEKIFVCDKMKLYSLILIFSLLVICSTDKGSDNAKVIVIDGETGSHNNGVKIVDGETG